MNERALTVFEQYELDITETFKIRGNYGCNTPDGKYILQEYDNSNDKMVSMKSLYNHLESSGIKTDYVIPNKEDRYVSVSEDGYTYILKKWFESQECNINEEKHIVMGAANLGRFHTLCQNSQRFMEKTKGFHPGKNMLVIYEKHNKEIINIRNYIKKRKNKNYFELALKEMLVEYYSQADEALKALRQTDYGKMYNNALEHKNLNHGSYNHHNIVLLNGKIAMINMSKINYAPAIQDVYDYLRKVMEKNNWNIDLGRKVLAEYESEKIINQEEHNILKIMFSYPEKFWKIINYYFNSNKAWYSEKNEEKLKQLQNQEEIRKKFIENM